MKVICIDNSIQSSPSNNIEKYLFIPQLIVGNEYSVIEERQLHNGITGYILDEINCGGTGFLSTRFIECDAKPVEEVVEELCN